MHRFMLVTAATETVVDVYETHSTGDAARHEAELAADDATRSMGEQVIVYPEYRVVV